MLQQGDEQCTRFSLALDPEHSSALRIQGTRKIALDVLPRSLHLLLLAANHPVQTDFRVEMDIDFIFVNRDVSMGQRGQQVAESVQTSRFRGFRPRATNHWTWAAASRFDQGQGPTHGTDVDTHASLPDQSLDEQFPRPSRATPAILLRRGPHDLVQSRQKVFIQLGLAVIFPGIPQAPFTAIAEAPGYPIHGRVMHAQHLRRLIGRAITEKIDDDQESNADTAAVTPTQLLTQLPLDGEAHPAQNRRHGNSLLGARRPENVYIWGIPIFFGSASTFKILAAESRTVI